MVIFESMPAFLSVYIPLVALAIIGVIKEDKLVAFEQKLKRKIKRWANGR